MFVFFMFLSRYLLSCNVLYFLYVHDKYKVVKINKRFDICGKNKLIINRKISLCLNVPMACAGYKKFLNPLLLEFRILLENPKYKMHGTRSWEFPIVTNVVFGCEIEEFNKFLPSYLN